MLAPKLILITLGLSLPLTLASFAQDQTPAAKTPWTVPSDLDIRKILAERVDTQRQSVGIVVGIVDPSGRRIVSYGTLNQGDKRTLDGNTEFEIGSNTKVFTSLILADMAQRGEVSLDDPVAKFLPSDVKMPTRNGKQITLIDLSTHTSGLPRMPDNLKPVDLEDPNRDYTVDQLYEFLDGYSLLRDIGAQFQYSNLGVELLGHALSLRAGMDYESLVRQRISGPLGMKDTAINLSPGMATRMAVGHDAALQAVKSWEQPALPGAGALHSTANDLLTFLSAELGNSSLKQSMARQLSVRRPAGAPNMAVALGWFVRNDQRGTVIWHNGGTGGFRTFMGFNPETRTGVVILTNASSADGPDDIGFHLLNGAALANIVPPKLHTEISLDVATKQGFVGQYQLSPNSILTISLVGNQLFAQPTGKETFPMFPESPTQLFCKCMAEAQISFVMGANGRAASLVLHTRGRDVSAQRIE
jgi:CubicO group peptidase (beta-lactamase class C family)